MYGEFVQWLTSGESAPPLEDAPPGACRGVLVGWLRDVLLPLVWAEIGRECVDSATGATRPVTTADVCLKIVRPATESTKCRYVELEHMRGTRDVILPGVTLLGPRALVGRTSSFASHCWGAPFADLVAALCHGMSDDAYVFVDIFAVKQHYPDHASAPPDIQADLDFVPIVQACGSLILCAAHLPSVAALPVQAAQRGMMDDGSPLVVTAADRARCAFWRVWCLVELAAALAKGVPVVMLVGGKDGSGGFVPELSMLQPNLGYLVDVGSADATVKNDIPLIMDQMLPKIIGVDSRAAAIEKGEPERHSLAHLQA